MVRVPTYDEFQAPAAGALPAARVAAPEIHDVAGRQAQQLGQGMSSFGGVLAEIALDKQNQAKQARIADATAQLVQYRTDLQVEALGLLGRNALERPGGLALPEEYGEKLQQRISSIASSLGNDAQRVVFQQQAAQLKGQFYSTLSSHMLQQQKAYQLDTQKATLDTAMDQAARLGADEKMFSQALGAIRATVTQQTLENGGDEQIAAAEYRKLADQTYYTRYKVWQQDDPVAALRSFQAHRQDIGPLMRDRIGDELFRTAAPQLANAAKSWVVGPGASPANAPDQTGAPRGIRNNNPGNIVQTSNLWQGEVRGNDPRYKTFATAEAGIKAMGENLLAYQDKYGLNTVDGIVSRWAPATENDTAGYITTVAKKLGVKPGERIDLHDQATMTKLIGAMIGVENGKQPYTDVQIATGVNAALGKVSLPAVATQAAQINEPAWRDPTATTGDPIIDNLPPDQRAQVFSLAHSQIRQDVAQARDSLSTRIADAKAEYLASGSAINPPSEGEFIQAYGQDEGLKQYRDFQGVAALGQKLQQTKTLSNAELTALVENDKPMPGDGFATRKRNHEILQQAVQQTIEARQKDPMQFALQNSAFGLQPIRNPGNLNDMATELGRRSEAMYKIATDYGTRPAIMTNAEADSFGRYVESLQPADKARVLGTIAAVTDVAGIQSLSAQLKDKHNTLAIAAMLASYTTDPTTHWFGPDTPGTNIGQMYLEGKDAIDQKRVKIDATAETGIKAQIAKVLDGVYQTPQGRDAAAEAAYGLYAKLEVDGKGDVDKAVQYATGGLMDLNGGKIAKPWGWTDDRFSDAMADVVPKAIKETGRAFIVGTQRVSAADFAKSLPGARLQTYGQGTYLVMSGNDVARNADGSPYILRVGP